MKRPGKNALLDADGLWQYATRILAARSYSVSELRDRLRRKAARAGDVGEVLGRLVESKLVDDARYAESFASARLENQGYGKQRVLRDLRARRVPDRFAQKAVEAVFGETDEGNLIEAYLARKYRNVNLSEHLADPRRLAAAYRKLRYAGFGASNSIRVLKRYAERAGEMEELEGD